MTCAAVRREAAVGAKPGVESPLPPFEGGDAKREKQKTTALDGERPFFIGSMLGQAGYFLLVG